MQLIKKLHPFTRDSQSGFSLIQTMIGLGLLGGLSLILWQMLHTASKAEQSVIAEAELLEKLDQVSRVLMDPQACEKSLKLDIQKIPTNEIFKFENIAIMNSDGDILLKKDQLIRNSLKIIKLKLTAADGVSVKHGTVFSVNLSIVAENSITKAALERKIGISVETDSSGGIHKCYSMGLDDDELLDLRSKICEDMDGTFIAGECKIGQAFRDDVCSALGFAANSDHCY